MIHIQSVRDGLPIFKALSSETRIAIIELLREEGPLPMNAICEKMNISAGALTPHIKELTACGLVNIEILQGKRGVQKVCSAFDERVMIESGQRRGNVNVYETEVGIGQYSSFDVCPTCGICTHEAILGEVDDPAVFALPEHVKGDILWFGSGFVEYTIPCYLKKGQSAIELQLSMEISSEAPGCSEDWPSDIYFRVNGVEVGFWTSPGDFGRNKGIYNPEWWFRNWNQHGLYKLLSIDESGTFMDGARISDTTVNDLNILPGHSVVFRMYVPSFAKNVGGLTVFGRTFGNYPQDIRLRMHYRENE